MSTNFSWKALLAISFAILGLVAGAVMIYRYGHDSSDFRNRNQGGPQSRVELDRELLQNLSWQEVAGGRFSWRADSENSLSQLLEWTEGSTNDATVYFRGLLLVASSKPVDALNAFDSIAIDAIPTEQLYAPYRLHDVLKPSVNNRYHERLLSNMTRELLSPLLTARILARASRFEESLKAYLGSDPKQWTAYDAECMRRIAAHSGLQSEVRRMVLAAIGGGRIPSASHDQFSRVAFRGTDDEALRLIRQDFRSTLVSNPSLVPVVTSSVEAIQKDRQLFLAKKYRELLETHRNENPTDQTSESALMLFLSALSERDRELSTTWGQELKRRHPHPETTRWVQGLIVSTFSNL